jgi:thioesterase domain-containing protein
MNDSTPALHALVVYESMFGNTEKIAGAVADGLRQQGLEVTLAGVLDAAPADTYTYDVLVVGAPTHAFSLSRASTRSDAVRQGAPAAAAGPGLRDWIAAMKRSARRTALVAAAFDTRVSKVRHIPKAASTRAAHMLARNGFQVLRPKGFVVTDIAGPLEDGELARAAAWGRSIGSAVVERTVSAV